MIVMCQIRQEPGYRREAFLRGLKAVGYRLVPTGRPTDKRDLLVIWNRYGGQGVMADTWEREGGTVLVCENGYVGKDDNGRQFYAISANGHNGSGWWPEGTEDRFATLGIEVKPWTVTEEGHYLVCGQRGIGTPLMASPNAWERHMVARIRRVKPDARTLVRLHPGNAPAKTHLEDDLKGAYACVIWSSSSGVKALVNGVPVYYDAPHWICGGGATPASKIGGFALVDDGARMQALRRMAWAQWSVAEIEQGEPFRRFQDLLECRL